MASLTPTGSSFCSVNLVLVERKEKVAISNFATGVEPVPLASCDQMINYSCATRASSFLTCLRVTLISIHPFRNVTTQSKFVGLVLSNKHYSFFDSSLMWRKANFTHFNVTWNILFALLTWKYLIVVPNLRIFWCDLTYKYVKKNSKGESGQFSTPAELADVTFAAGIPGKKIEQSSSLQQRISQVTSKLCRKISFGWKVC